MKIALLGAMGFVGQAAARTLAGRPEVGQLLLVDYNIREAKKFAKALSPKCRWAMADVGRAPDLERLLDDVDGVANAVGPCAEYEKPVLLTCAGSKRPTASIGDGPLFGADRREIHDAFRRAGTLAVSGCGMLPGWTDLLAAHFLAAPSRGARPAKTRQPAGAKETGGTEGEAARFLFFSPARFGGYAFFRRVVREIGRPAVPPRCAPAGVYLEAGGGAAFGLPAGRPAGIWKALSGGMGSFGSVGRAMSAAFLFCLRRHLNTAEDLPAAAAGVIAAGENQGRFAMIIDRDGRLAGTLLAESVLRLVRGGTQEKGLLPLPEILGREEAEQIASACHATITRSRPDLP